MGVLVTQPFYNQNSLSGVISLYQKNKKHTDKGDIN